MHERILSQGLFDNAAIGIKVSDCSGRIIEANPACCRFLGYDRDALLGLSGVDLCHSNDRAYEQQQLDRLISAQISHLTFRKRYLSGSGKIIWGDTTVTAVRDASGTCEALVTMVVDVTEQRYQQLLLQGQAEILNKLYCNDSLEAICTSIVETIEAVEEGLLCSILQFNPVSQTLHKLAAPNLPAFYNEAIEGMAIGDGIGSCGTSAFRKERVIVTDILAHPYWARARRLVEKTPLRACWSQPIFASDGSVLGTFAIYYTEPREPGPFELELICSAANLAALAINHKRAMAALSNSDQLKSEFISTAAHELRTPIASILGFAELLAEPDSSNTFSTEQRHSFLHEIIESTEHLNQIIDDILDLGRIESGRCLPMRKEPTRLAELLTKVVNRFRLEGKHILTLDVTPEIPDLIPVDQHRINQVLDNILSNATKYSPPGSSIAITAARSGCVCQITIVDQGIGMNSDQVRQVFDKFYRADASDTAVRGLGLGMSIVKQIVEDHGGRIWVESAEGKGCKVTFTLPITAPLKETADS